jgi:uncharacterized protein (DUF58 family)
VSPPLTRAGWLVVAGSGALLVAARTLALPELYVLGAVGLALAVVAVTLVLRPLPALEVERTVHPRRVHLGDPSRVELRVANPSGRRLPLVTLHDPVEGTTGAALVVAPLPPGAHRRAGYRLPTRRRGLVRVGPLVAVREDPFGLATRSTPLAGALDLTVLPVVEPLGDTAPGSGRDDALTGVAHPRPGRVGGDDFASLREYVVGDDLRRVHWASTARTGDLLVRQDDPPWQGQLTVVLDARADRIDGPAFETAVSAAASLLNAAAERGERTRLLVTDGFDSGPADARTALDLLLERLALVDRHTGGTLPHLPDRDRPGAGELVVITGRLTPADFTDLSRFDRRGATTRVVVVTDDPGRISTRPPEPTRHTGVHPTPSVDVSVLATGRPVATALGATFATFATMATVPGDPGDGRTVADHRPGGAS